MPKQRNSFESFLGEWNLKSLHEPDSTPPPSSPKFPTFVELVELDRQGVPPPKSPGLFEALLGRPEPLYVDSVEHPEKYSPEVVALLSELVAGTKKVSALNPGEERLLDLATIDFATAAPEKPKAPPPTPVRRSGAEERVVHEQPIVGVDVPQEAQAPYWWLK